MTDEGKDQERNPPPPATEERSERMVQQPGDVELSEGAKAGQNLVNVVVSPEIELSSSGITEIVDVAPATPDQPPQPSGDAQESAPPAPEE